MRRNEREIAVDPIVLGEVRSSILLLPRGKRRSRLERWFDAGVMNIHCVPLEVATGFRWAQLLAELRASGRVIPIKDSLIAATLLVHQLPVATRNRSDFEKAGVDVSIRSSEILRARFCQGTRTLGGNPPAICEVNS